MRTLRFKNALRPRVGNRARDALIWGTFAIGLILEPAIAIAKDQFYKGKELTIYVAFSAGGGYDTYARLLSRHIASHLVGNPTTVVQNMPGAGGLKLTNYLYNIAPKDGSAIGIIEPGSSFEPLYGNADAKFDATKFTWIGGINSEISTCQAWHTSPVKSFDDALKSEMIVGGTGSNDGNVIYPRVLNNVFGTKFKLIAGYTGTNDIMMAMERGEVHGICGLFWSSILARNAKWLNEGKIIPLVQLGLEKHPKFPNVPLALDMAKTEEERQILEFTFASTKMGRPFVGPPGLPDERASTLRSAFASTMKDEKFLAEAKKLKIEVSPTAGEQLSTIIARIYKTPKASIDRMLKIRSK